MIPPRMLLAPPLVWLGKRAYGLYLWHWPIYEIARLFPRGAVVPAALALTLATAAISYRVIELPFLRLKGRFNHH